MELCRASTPSATSDRVLRGWWCVCVGGGGGGAGVVGGKGPLPPPDPHPSWPKRHNRCLFYGFSFCACSFVLLLLPRRLVVGSTWLQVLSGGNWRFVKYPLTAYRCVQGLLEVILDPSVSASQCPTSQSPLRTTAVRIFRLCFSGSIYSANRFVLSGTRRVGVALMRADPPNGSQNRRHLLSRSTLSCPVLSNLQLVSTVVEVGVGEVATIFPAL